MQTYLTIPSPPTILQGKTNCLQFCLMKNIWKDEDKWLHYGIDLKKKHKFKKAVDFWCSISSCYLIRYNEEKTERETILGSSHKFCKEKLLLSVEMNIFL